MSRRLLALLMISLATLTACGRISATHPAAGGYRVFLEEGFSGGGEQITVRDSGTGAIERTLPIGTPAPDWSRYYTVTTLTGSARLNALDPGSGRTIAQAVIPSGFALPNLGFQGPSAGLSPNGKWLALTDNGRAVTGKLVTSFLVGASSLSGSFKTVRVDGAFSFDALSDDGLRIYLIEKMGDPNHYQVRLYDLGTNSLSPYPVVDKLDPKEPMTGIRGDSAADPLGNYVFTVYARDNGPFIHALPLDQPFAFCVDLPKDAVNDIEQQFRWSLAITQDGSTVYAANASLGRIAVLSTQSVPQIIRTGAVAMSRPGGLLAGLVTEADAKGPRIGGTALSLDGRTLFAIGNNGVLAIDTSTLKVRTRFLESETIDSIRLSSDGKWLYAAAAGASQLWQIDPATGVAGEVKGVTNPWALLWAAPRN
jgi:DNA-binding beta-propeller fold protein YncE